MPGARWPLLPAAFVFASLASLPARALAQTGDDVATAQALFDDGKRLMQEGHYDLACPKLVESQRLDPGGGTLLAIAICHEGEGKVATAWGDFNEALSEARKDHRPEREKAALDRIHALEQKMPRARVMIASTLPGLEVHRDGTLVGAAQWGTALPIDPGPHHFDATAPGKKPWQGDVTIPAEAKTIDVPIPTLEDAPPPPPPPTPTATLTPPPPPPSTPTPTSTPPPPPPPPPPPTSNPLRTWTFATAGAAVVLVGVGAGFGLSAASKWNSAKSTCIAAQCTDPNAPSLESSAGSAADVSTVFFTVGAVGVAASVVLLVLSGGSDHAAPPAAAARAIHVTPTFGAVNGLAIGGSL